MFTRIVAQRKAPTSQSSPKAIQPFRPFSSSQTGENIKIRFERAQHKGHNFGNVKVNDAPSNSSKAARHTPIPHHLQNGLEKLSGMDFSNVRVHYNSAKPARLQAFAHTQGNDIHLGPGQERHLSHEAWHVVQQRQGRVKANVQMKGLPVNDNASLEREADVMGARASSGGSASGTRAISVAPASNSTSHPTDSV